MGKVGKVVAKGKPQDADKKKARIRRKKENRVTKARKSGKEKEAVADEEDVLSKRARVYQV